MAKHPLAVSRSCLDVFLKEGIWLFCEIGNVNSEERMALTDHFLADGIQAPHQLRAEWRHVNSNRVEGGFCGFCYRLSSGGSIAFASRSHYNPLETPPGSIEAICPILKSIPFAITNSAVELGFCISIVFPFIFVMVAFSTGSPDLSVHTGPGLCLGVFAQLHGQRQGWDARRWIPSAYHGVIRGYSWHIYNIFTVYSI